MKNSPPHSRRLKRLRLTASLLFSAILLITASVVFFHWKSIPPPYQPDEQSGDIKSVLARSLPKDAPQPRFTDVTHAAGLAGFRNFAGERTSELPEDMGPGLAWGDFDNDGDDDLFLVSAGGALNLPANKRHPCVLFENLGSGTFHPFAEFPETRILGNGAAWGDYDGDGFLDLILSGYQTLLLFRNQAGTGGQRRFVRDLSFPNPPGFWTGVSWGDFNNDRAPDLYVCDYLHYAVSEDDRQTTSAQIGTKVPFTLNPASFHGGTNLLFQNNLSNGFSEVSAQLRVQNPEGRSLGALWHDFDEDGWLDLYVANDISDNVFFRNRAGLFEDISHSALVADYRSAMGLAVGDHDRDGDDDLFISHWIAQENAFYDNSWADFNRHRPPSTNGLSTTNQYALRFFDIADQKGLGQIALPYVGWGTEFVDFDGDGWLDLVVANGNTLEQDGVRPRKLKPQDTLLFWNQQGQFFHNIAPLHPGLAEKHVSRGLALSDFDNDGDMDFIIADLGEGVRLFRNDMQTGHWLKIRLRSRNHHGKPIGFADGSKVIVHAGGSPIRRSISSVSYLSQSSRTLHFGLGSATHANRIEVRWLGGSTSSFDNLKANATYELTENDPIPRKIQPAAPPLSPQSQSHPLSDRQHTRNFWSRQRAAMAAMKVEKNNARAAALFREALLLDPAHEDSLYYLASCLASLGEIEEALDHLAHLKRINPQSQRAFIHWGTLRALSARSADDLHAAEVSLKHAHAVNPEETGALLILGEVALLRGNSLLAEEQLAAACRTNPKATGGFFLRAYLAWKGGRSADAVKLLQQARASLGPDWQPKGATSEGDVQQKQHVEKTPLSAYWELWDGTSNPDLSFAPIDRYLNRVPR